MNPQVKLTAMGELNLVEFQLASLVMFLASMLQATVGFGAGLLGIPLLMLVLGASLPEAVMALLLASMVQNAGGVFSLRGDLDLREAAGPIAIRIVAIPIGMAALWLSDTRLSPQHVKMVLGVVLLGLVTLQWFAAPKHAVKLHEMWKWIAFSASGFLVGFVGMGGPPMVLWVMAQPWTSTKSRAFLFLMFLSSLLPHCLLLYWLFGSQVVRGGWICLIGIPAIVAGTWVGLRVGALLPKSRLQVLAYGVLVLTALAAIAAPFEAEISQAVRSVFS